MRAWSLLLVVGLLGGCRSKSTEPGLRAEGSAQAAFSQQSQAKAPPSAAPSASAAPPPPAIEVRPREPTPPLDDTQQAALARARKLQAEGNLEQAKVEFLKAWGGPSVHNLQPLVELGYLLLQHEPASIDDAAAYFRAGTRSSDAAVEAQAWYNLAIVHGRHGHVEAERAALARSLVRRDNKTVRAKLGGRSACVAEVVTDVHQTVSLVSGWAGVCDAMGRCGLGNAPNDPRTQSCVTAAGADNEEQHGCQGAGPWESSWNYSWFTSDAAWIAPLAGDRFFVAVGRAGGWPARCQGTHWPEWTHSGSYVVAEIDEHQLEPFPDRDTPHNDPENGVCLDGPGTTVTAVFSTSTAKLLAAVRLPGDFGVSASLDENAKQLVLRGGGCDGHLRTDGSARFVPR